MTSIGGMLRPVRNSDNHGLYVRLGHGDNPDIVRVHAPIAPGYFRTVGVRKAKRVTFRSELRWHGDPQILLYLLSAGRMVLVCDAFDEMGVAQVGRTVEEQFRQLVSPAGQQPAERRGNRILITCRSHFFQSLRDQLGALSGRQREVVTETDYL